MNLALQLVLWSLMWMVFLGFFLLVMTTRGIDHLKNFHLTSVYFLICSIFSFYIFRSDILRLVPRISSYAIIYLVLFYVATVPIHYLVRKYFESPKEYIRKNPRLYFLPLDYRHIVSNTFIVLFQQILFVAIISILYYHGYSTSAVVTIFVILSFFAHIFLVHQIGWRWGLYFTFFAMLGAVFFPLLILYVKDGVVYAFMIHSAFYTLSGVGVWILNQDKI